MRTINRSIQFVILSFAFGANAASLSCGNSLSGNSAYGTTGTFCSVSPLQTQAFVKSQYSPVLYQSSAGTYMSAMFPVLRDAGKYYIHRRNPKVSGSEEEGFISALYAVAAQESRWSHYRVANDGVARSMRGDHLHGYGLLQIDDRWHSTQIKEGKGTDLVENVLFGLDVFYSAWTQSASAKCVGSSSDYKSRARAAWSAYNGGSGNICRFAKKPTSGDKDFLTNYNKHPWATYVRDPGAKAPIDVKCLAEGTRPCKAPL